MAITLITAPTSPVLAYSPVMFQLNSNNADIVHLIIETVVSYDGSVTSIRKSATSIQPNLTTTNEFTFDVSDILSANLSFILKTLGASSVINDTDNLQFKIKQNSVLEQLCTCKTRSHNLLDKIKRVDTDINGMSSEKHNPLAAATPILSPVYDPGPLLTAIADNCLILIFESLRTSLI